MTLRTAPRPPHTADSPDARTGHRWAIVGGGMLGMTLAFRLAQRGHAVTLFEAAPSLGGLASAWQLGDVVWDRHYHVTLYSDTWLRALLGELGLDAELEWRRTRTGFFVDGRLHSMSSLPEFLRFPPLGLVDKLRLGATILHASRVRDGRRLEHVPVEAWLRRWSGSRTFERIWRPLLRAKLGDSYRRTSAAFIWATINRMYAARRSGLKHERFGYVRGGYARVLERYGEALGRAGVSVRCAQPVRRVERAEEGQVGLDLVGRGPECFDRVVLTVPAPVAAGLAPGLAPPERALLEGVEYQGILCASLLLRHALSDFYITNITDGWVPFTAVIEMSALVDRRHFLGDALVYLPKYVSGDDPAWGRSDADIADEFVRALRRMHPHVSPDDVRCFRLSRVRHVFALPTLGYSQRLPPVRTSVPGLFVVSSAHVLNGTLNVNETVRLATESVDGLVAEPSRRA